MILLDTHIWLWIIAADPKLPANIHQIATAKPDELMLSPISLWETMMLAERGRIGVIGDPANFVRRLQQRMKIVPAPLNSDIAILSRELPFSHEDPADRFLAATAKHYGVPLATIDTRLIQLPWLQTVS